MPSIDTVTDSVTIRCPIGEVFAFLRADERRRWPHSARKEGMIDCPQEKQKEITTLVGEAGRTQSGEQGGGRRW